MTRPIFHVYVFHSALEYHYTQNMVVSEKPPRDGSKPDVILQHPFIDIYAYNCEGENEVLTVADLILSAWGFGHHWGRDHGCETNFMLVVKPKTYSNAEDMPPDWKLAVT